MQQLRRLVTRLEERRHKAGGGIGGARLAEEERATAAAKGMPYADRGDGGGYGEEEAEAVTRIQAVHRGNLGRQQEVSSGILVASTVRAADWLLRTTRKR